MACMRRLASLCVLLVGGSFAHAQDVPAITPSSHRAEVGAPITLVLKNAATGAPIAWEDDRVSWFYIRIENTQRNFDIVPRVDDKAGVLKLDSEGAAVIGVDFKPRVVHIDAAALRAFARDHMDAAIPEAAEGELAVRLVESAKTVVRIGKSEEGQSGTVSEKAAQLVELRPSFDPTGVGIGSTVPFQTIAASSKVKNARVIATHIGSGEKQDLRSNGNGAAMLKLSRAGQWRVEMYHLVESAKVESAPDDGAAWILYTATLTFETVPRPDKKEEQK